MKISSIRWALLAICIVVALIAPLTQFLLIQGTDDQVGYRDNRAYTVGKDIHPGEYSINATNLSGSYSIQTSIGIISREANPFFMDPESLTLQNGDIIRINNCTLTPIIVILNQDISG